NRQSIQAVQAIDRKTEFDGDRLDQFLRAHDRIEDEGSGIMPVELLEHRAAERRLAGANFPRELHEPFALPDTIKQVIECLAMLDAIKKKARVRRDVERRLAQAIILQVHPDSL